MVNRLLVRILGLEIKIPLFILLKALGMKNDKEIISHIIYNGDSPDIKSNMMNILRYAVKDSEPVYTQTAAILFMSVNTKGKEIINVIDLLNNNLLPHYKDHKQKAYFLAYSTRKILLTHLGVLSSTDRDLFIKEMKSNISVFCTTCITQAIRINVQSINGTKVTFHCAKFFFIY